MEPRLVTLTALAAVMSIACVAHGEDIPSAKLPELLRQIADANERNISRIDRWHAKYEFEDTFEQRIITAPPRGLNSGVSAVAGTPAPTSDATITRYGHVEFYFDADANRFLLSYDEDASRVKAVLKNGGEMYAAAYTPFKMQVLRSGREQIKMISSVEFGPLPNFHNDPNHLSGASGRLATRNTIGVGELHNVSDEVIDPKELFQCQVGNTIAWTFRSVADAIEGRIGADQQRRAIRLSSARKEREMITVTICYCSSPVTSPQDILTSIDEFTFATDRLDVPIKFVSVDPNQDLVTEKREWEWQKDSTSEAFIPQAYRITLRARNTGQLVVDRLLTLQSFDVNRELIAALYDETIPLQRGDRVRDAVNNDLLLYDGKKLISVNEGIAPRNSYYLLAAFFAIVASVFAVWSRNKRNQSIGPQGDS